MITAALDCFLNFGVRKTSLTDVADRAGVSRATAYRAFGDKNGLVRAVAEAEVTRFLDRLDTAVAWDAALADALEQAITFTLGYLRGHAVLQRLISSEPEQLTDIVVPRPGEASLVQVLLPAVVERFVRTHHDVLRVPIDQAAEWLVRMSISMLLSPDTTLPSPRAVADLLIAGLVDPETNEPTPEANETKVE
ncbi:MAG TPA: TetR/AcrR family transcriptional regulator [Pseudonocardiaceae bacterium]|jgi:AcrR family transcriptional regulator|nr:TetR/AcrR family transcriptional regulator [Pseudonocardiaceae bacterium]